MYGRPKSPRDTFSYLRSADSRPLAAGESGGRYVFVVDLDEVIHVAPDGLHTHPKVLGGARPALYAGELVIDPGGHVEELTNLSGTFRFNSRRSLCCVAAGVRRLGFSVGEVVWYPANGGVPVVLTCE